MSSKRFNFQIFALNTKPVILETVSVSLPVCNGTITVLPGHTPLITSLEIGIVSVQEKAKEKIFFAIMGGIAQITPDKVVIFTNAYEEGKKIPEDERGFSQWSKEITYERKKDEEKIRFYLINTIKKWKKAHLSGNTLNL